VCMVNAGCACPSRSLTTLNWHTSHDQQRCVRVAQVVEPDVRHRRLAPQGPVEELAEGLGVGEPPGCVEEHPVVRPVAVEPAAPVGEHVHGLGVEVEAARAGAGLDVELTGLPATFWIVRVIDRRSLARSRSDHLRAGDLTAAHAGERGEVERRVEAEPVGGGEEGCELPGRPGASDLGRRSAMAGVGRKRDVRLEQLSAHGQPKRRTDHDIDVVDRLGASPLPLRPPLVDRSA